MKRVAFLLAVLWAVSSRVGWAQPRAMRPPGPPGEEAFKLVKAYILSDLQERVGLSEEQYVKLLPLVNRLYDDRHQFARQKDEALGEMTRLLRAGQATESALVALLGRVRTIEDQEPSAIAKDLRAIEAVLTPVQQAKYRVYEAEVERRIRELIRRRRREEDPERRRPLRDQPEP